MLTALDASSRCRRIIYSLFANVFAYFILLTPRASSSDLVVLNKIFLMYLLNNQPIMNAELHKKDCGSR
jgi:hypothetical protein